MQPERIFHPDRPVYAGSSPAAADPRRPASGAGGGGGAAALEHEPVEAGPPPLSNPHDGPFSPETTRFYRRVAALILLLEGLVDWRSTLRAGDGDSYRDGALLLFEHESHCLLLRHGRRCSCVQSGLDETERLLAVMRRQRPFERWHVRAWFVDAEWRGRWVERPRKGRRPAALVYRREVLRDPRADRGRALDGVAWLASAWNLRDLRDELVEPWLVAPGLDRQVFDKLDSRHSGLVRSVAGSRL